METRTWQGLPCLIGGLPGKILEATGADACYAFGRLVFRSKETWNDKHTRHHELAHHKQAQADPLFSLKYLLESALNGYEGNAYEVDADAYADAALRRCRKRSRSSASRRSRRRR